MRRPDDVDFDSLIISRYEEMELTDFRPRSPAHWSESPVNQSVYLSPFLQPLPLRIGLHLNIIGTTVVGVKVERHFFRQGLDLEPIALKQFTTAISGLARLSWTTPIVYQLALQTALEKLFAVKARESDLVHRCFYLECARLLHHASVLGKVLRMLNLDHLVAKSAYVEKRLAPILAPFCQVDQPEGKEIELNAVYDTIEEGLALVHELETDAKRNRALIKALEHKAKLNFRKSVALGLGGLFLRSNRTLETIQDNPYLPYHSPIELQINDSACAWARFSLRLKDMLSSLKFMHQHVNLCKQQQIPLSAPFFCDTPFANNEPKAFAAGELLGPEGRAKAVVFYSATNGLFYFTIRTQAYYIAQAIPFLLANLEVREVPLMLASLGITAEEIDK